MTLDEAIKHEEENAIQQIEKANALDNIPLFGMSKDDIEEIKECYKCAEEHRQLAEWLKDYKRLLEQEPCTDAISRQQVKSDYTDWFCCSECGSIELKKSKYCPNCGAKMQ